ncbi:MAG: hypothetical protein ACLTXT_04360 [Ruminococcus callidus]
MILIEGVEQYPKTDKGYTYDTADICRLRQISHLGTAHGGVAIYVV